MRCYGCMNEYSDEYEICPYCGYIRESKPEEALQMEPGTLLKNRYIIGKAIGCGGFGVTYLGWDTQEEMKVAIKEYLPSEFATRIPGQMTVTVFSGEKTEQFGDGLDKFSDEARRLAKFKEEKGIVTIYDNFEDNNTAYIVMEYLDGETLASFLKREGKIKTDRAITMLIPIMESLSEVHETGIIHRDIAPDNIYITKNGDVKLIDFGAARYATTSYSRSLSVIVKPGYSPEEQYRSNHDQGPHTDVYALGGVLYKMITGVTPPDAMERRAQFEGRNKDILEPISKYTQEITENQETAIMNALNVRIDDRTPDVVSLVGELLSEEPVERRMGRIKKIDILKWPLWLKVAAPTAIATVCTLLILLLTGVIHFSTPETEIDLDGMVRVPSVVNMTFDDAEKMLEDKGGLLNIVIGDGQPNNEIDENRIYFQNPDAASKVLPGTEILATISYGPEKSRMINVIGYTKELAKQELENLKFDVKFIEKESNDAAGSVIAQSVEEGKDIPQGNTITLTISKGNSNVDTSVSVKVPNIVGKTMKKAKSDLSAYYLSPSIDGSVYSDRPEGEILEQYPTAGSGAHQGDIVYVVVSLGTEKAIMPKIIGKNSSDAASVLSNNRLTLGNITEEVNESYNEGCVIRATNASGKTISAGTELKVGTKINLVVSKSSKVTVPNVVGKSKSAAVSALSENFVVKVQTVTTDATKDNVVKQSPSANTKVSKNSTVTIYVSTGPTEKATTATTTKSVTLSSISITQKPNKTEYWIGESFSSTGMKVTAYYSDGSSKEITGYSTDVNTNTEGTSTLKVSYTSGGATKTATTTINVKKPYLEFNTSGVSVKEGNSTTVQATTYPSGKTVSWKISDTSIATVSSGTVKGVKSGSTTLTASFVYESKTYQNTCSVTVSEGSIAVEEVSVSPSSNGLNVGDTLQLYATVLPQKATNKTVSWSSSNSSVASVSSSGLVTAKASGSATITATAGGKTGKCTITVAENYCTIIFDSNGGNCSKSSMKVPKGTKLGSIDLPSATKSYTVRFNANGGGSVPSSITGAGEVVEWAPIELYNKAVDDLGGDTSSDEIDNYVINDDTTLIAVYMDVNMFQKAVVDAVQVAMRGATKTNFVCSLQAQRDGYIFKGWAKSPTSTEVFCPYSSCALCESITCYAVWEKE